MHKLYRMRERGETDLTNMDIPDEMKDENLWTEAVLTFDKIVREDTPSEKRMVIFRTLHIAKQTWNMNCWKRRDFDNSS